jgi:tetrahydromethanopterin S-methyltransferase subunit C
MQASQYFLLSMTAILFVVAGFSLVHDLCAEVGYRRAQMRGMDGGAQAALRWRVTVSLALLAWVPFLLAVGMAVLPVHGLLH